MPNLGAINNVYRGALDADAGHGVSPQQAYARAIAGGANPNEALFLVSAAASESRLNPGASHDNGAGYGLFGHNGSRLIALRQYAQQHGGDISDWGTQLDFGLQELRSRPEGKAVANATSPEQLGMAQMYFERPQGFTPDNPEAGHNYTGRVNQIRYLTGLNPSATGTFAPSANPQVTPQQMGAAVPSSSGGSPEGDFGQLLADYRARMHADSASRPPPLIAQLFGMAVSPIRDAVSDGLTALLSGGETGALIDANAAPQNAPPRPSMAPAGPMADLSPPSPRAAPAAPPLPAPRPSDASQPFMAAGLPGPRQPAITSIAPAPTALPTFAQGGGLDGLAMLLGGGVTKPSSEVL